MRSPLTFVAIRSLWLLSQLHRQQIQPLPLGQLAGWAAKHSTSFFSVPVERPAVRRGCQVLADLRKPLVGDKEREILFGKTQYEKR